MGICIALQTEVGNTIELIPDDKQLLHKLLPPPNDDSDSMLGWIDWYGNTLFNHLQMKRFLAEWDQLAMRARTSEEKTLLSRIRDLAVRCQEERTLNLRFIGD
ncbi:MAG: hypothetical protein LAN36_02495 [Acidobacteriia bacterium]|nr:hypothetical protein [Terriglobia bacterium]